MDDETVHARKAAAERLGYGPRPKDRFNLVEYGQNDDWCVPHWEAERMLGAPADLLTLVRTVKRDRQPDIRFYCPLEIESVRDRPDVREAREKRRAAKAEAARREVRTELDQAVCSARRLLTDDEILSIVRESLA